MMNMAIAYNGMMGRLLDLHRRDASYPAMHIIIRKAAHHHVKQISESAEDEGYINRN